MAQTFVTQDNFKSFKKHYNKAVKDNKTFFDFEGQHVLVTYAKYLIEYGETKFKKT